MGIARVRPSRNIYEFSFTVANLPDAESKSCTIECTGLPNRGILRRVSLLTQDGAAISAQDVHMFLLSSAGSATSNSGGDTALTSIELNSAFYVTSFRLADAPEGALDTDSTGGTALFAAHIELLGPQGATQIRPSAVAYDVSGVVLGPDASDGVVYAGIVAKAALNGLSVAKLRLEIEPCF